MRIRIFRHLLAAATLLCASQAVLADQNGDNVYFNMGVHNTKGCTALNNNCIAKRKAGEPTDPQFPATWISDWTMYRVTNNYEKNPPPYSSPPSTLQPNDYTMSQGTSYYDNTYVPADGDGTGAMMEHYEKYCLPIFPIKDNNYTCSFVSLGNKAYFLTYPEDRPKDMPACCMFSPMNHPPRQDFVKHLPYSASRSQNLGGSVLAYALELKPQGQPPILFGYAFNKQATSDGPGQPAYQHPQSFYFSGDASVANAPIVSQNYRNWSNAKPDPAKTWDQVAQMCPANPPDCQLFTPPPSLKNGARPQWNQLAPISQ
ncbi:hypothetical protein H7A76_09075 [Pseudomonas sp. MSSRFD41]|uniref:hypothetical protein n=1 Tax=unclassified Pseudomonas TaxID=196821 RepID=UPI00163AD639|nr:hypothetical protein [Pseudomonas sp. MSSRFD41]MBC2655586.1 hypothetical protein [Pseudomonas sp. MSSRFD41]